MATFVGGAALAYDYFSSTYFSFIGISEYSSDKLL